MNPIFSKFRNFVKCFIALSYLAVWHGLCIPIPNEQKQWVGTMEVTGNIALSRMVALRQQMDIVANNVANMNTTGYKAVEMRMAESKVSGKAAGITPGNNGYSMVMGMGTVRDIRPGVITATGNPLDVAIQGKGYFAVQNENGEPRYTRNGVFQISATGQLVDLQGRVVQGSSGEINIPRGTTSVSIGQDGTVSTPTAVLGRIGLFEFADEQSLELDGDNGLIAPQGVEAQPVQNPKILQGSIESSNVNSVAAMTRMIEVQRQYQSAANILQEEHDRSRSTIKSLAKIN